MMYKKFWVFLTLALFALPSYAIGVTIVAAFYGGIAFSAFTTGMIITAVAINIVASAALSYAFSLATQPNTGGFGDGGSSPADTGSRMQVSPGTSNKLPVIYGTAWTGGIITDMSITENNQVMYYVLSLCEVTGTNGTADSITFGDIYYGGKKVIFRGDGYTVDKLVDESNSVEDTTVSGKIQIYLYSNGSSSPANSSTSAITVMQDSNLVYKWDSSKTMTNCAFAIIRLQYSISGNIRGINSTKIQITNARTKPGDCMLDYMQNARYGCAIPVAQIDTAALTALNTYSDESVSYTPYTGGTATLTRYRFNGQIDTARNCMDTLQDMMNCCDCILKYNEIVGKWSVIINRTDYTVVMDINDSNMISAMTITPLDIASSYNYVEVKFPDQTNQDAFNTASFDLAQIDPTLLYPNEPVNKVSVNLPFVNDDVRAQMLANRMLKASREDLQVTTQVNFVGLQFEAGDVVTITNANYGWTAKLFRIMKVTETFSENGAIIVKLMLSEFNPSVYSDASVTQFTPAPNTGIADPTFFGNVPAPLIYSQNPTDANPFFTVLPYASDAGIIQYAEIWYSAYSDPTESQRYFAGTTVIQSGGTPYNPGTQLPLVVLSNIPQGDWYIFARMVNNLASSAYSLPSALIQWRPTTFQYYYRYLCIAYGTDASGSGFSLDPRGKTWYGIYNSDSSTPPTEPSLYQWYDASPDFGTTVYLLFANRGGRKMTTATGFAAQAAGTATWVPTSTLIYDPSLWSALPDGTNAIDLDMRTGQVTQTGTTTVGTGEIALVNNPDGRLVAALQQYLDFGGAYTRTASVATLTIDIYGRVVGFEEPDAFYYSEQAFTATSGQTVFSVTRGTGYITGQCFVFENGCLLNTSEYTDAAGSVTFSTGRTLGDRIVVVSFKSYNSTSGYYASFTRNSATLTNQGEYTASGFTLTNGLELLFLNGMVVNAQDYDINDQTIGFINNTTGDLEIIQWSVNNLGVANGTPVNVDAFTIIGQTIYPFTYDANAFNLYMNGVNLIEGTDFTTATGTYTLTNNPTTATNIMVQQTFSRTGAV